MILDCARQPSMRESALGGTPARGTAGGESARSFYSFHVTSSSSVPASCHRASLPTNATQDLSIVIV